MVSGYLIKNNGKIDMLKMQQAIFIFVFVFTFALSFLKQLKQKGYDKANNKKKLTA